MKWGALVLLVPALAAGAGAPPADPELAARELFLSARMAAADGRLQDALQDYRQALQERPEDPVLHFELAHLLAQLDVEDQALAESRKAAQLDPTFAEAWTLAGSLDVEAAKKDAKRAGAAVDELEHAHQLDPQNPAVAVDLARAHLLDARPDLAREDLRDFAGDPGNPAYLKVLAEADDRRGADAAAREDYRQWLRSTGNDRTSVAAAIEFFESRQFYAEAIDLLRQLEAADSGNSAPADWIALDLLRSGRFSDAADAARKIVASRPEDRHARRTLAAALFQLGRGEESRAILRKMIEQDPNDPAPVFALAGEDATDGDVAGAIDALRDLDANLAKGSAQAGLKREVEAQISALELRRKEYDAARKLAESSVLGADGVNERALAVLAEIARHDKKPADGAAWVDKALASDPGDPDLRAMKAEFAILAGKRDEGEAALEEMSHSGIAANVLSACDAWSRLKDWRRESDAAAPAADRFAGNTDLLFRLGAALERQGKIEESAAAFERLLAIRPDDAPTLNYLGYTYADRGIKLPEARRMIARAVALDPFNGAYLDSLGWVCFRSGDMACAEKYMGEASRRMPDDPTVQEHLGDLALRQGQKAEALAHWRKSLSLSPDEPSKIEKKIEDLGRTR